MSYSLETQLTLLCRIPNYGTTMAIVSFTCMSRVSPGEDPHSRFPWMPFFKQIADHFWIDSWLLRREAHPHRNAAATTATLANPRRKHLNFTFQHLLTLIEDRRFCTTQPRETSSLGFLESHWSESTLAVHLLAS